MSAGAPLPADNPASRIGSRVLTSAELWLALAGLYALTGWLGLVLASRFGGVSVFWPPAAIALAALIQFGWRVLPGVMLGAVAVNLAAGNNLWGALAISVGNVGGTVLAGWLATRRGKLTLDEVNGVGLLVVAAVLGSVPAAIVGPLVVWESGGKLPGDPLMGAVVWWMGDMAGVLLITPLLMWPTLATQSPQRATVVWAGLFVSCVFAVGFAATPNVPDPASLMACLPIMAVAAARYGPRGLRWRTCSQPWSWWSSRSTTSRWASGWRWLGSWRSRLSHRCVWAR
ncbi:MAG: MASE1 domain-containing protein [Gemmataceae bacterium]